MAWSVCTGSPLSLVGYLLKLHSLDLKHNWRKFYTPGCSKFLPVSRQIEAPTQKLQQLSGSFPTRPCTPITSVSKQMSSLPLRLVACRLTRNARVRLGCCGCFYSILSEERAQQMAPECDSQCGRSPQPPSKFLQSWMYLITRSTFIPLKSFKAWQIDTAEYTNLRSASYELLKFEYEPFSLAQRETLLRQACLLMRNNPPVRVSTLMAEQVKTMCGR